MTVYLNGKFLPIGEAKISVLDRGFIYGDGVYELVPVYKREPYRLRQHLARLQRSLDGIRLANPHRDEQWEAIIRELIARQLAVDRGAVETVLFRDGYLTEASASNVLIVKSGGIVAPPKDNLILPGITYDATLELAREGRLPFEIRPVTKAEALTADEMWLSSSTKEVLAVTTLDGKPFAGGKPGPVYREMYRLFQESKSKSRVPA